MRAGKAADSIGRFCALPLFAVFEAAAFASDFFKSAKKLKKFSLSSAFTISKSI